VGPTDYYVEQAASLEWFLGAYWFAWKDEPVLGRMDGENYNIGFVDVTDRPYKELVEAAKVTHKRLQDVHSGKLLPFCAHPMASDAGAPSNAVPLGGLVYFSVSSDLFRREFHIPVGEIFIFIRRMTMQRGMYRSAVVLVSSLANVPAVVLSQSR